MDPAVPGPDLPPAGQSLFDSLTTDPLPFPISRLLEQIGAQAGSAVRFRRVLIPLGRSLQRSAAAPEFFRYPRAIAALDDSANPAIRDRLYLGYQEKAGVIEVLSYNRDAGRFEFQLVHDYREGALPKVYYARRRVCTVCHQNQAPLFPRQLWDETNANSRVSHLLEEEQRDYYGFPVAQTADEPYAIDLAVHRANELAVYQRLWAEAPPDARRDLAAAAVRCRKSGACSPPELGAWWRTRWPRGLAIPNPEIADRNPLAILTREGPADRAGVLAFLAVRQKTIEAEFEPAMPRSPLEFWYGDPERVERLVRGLAAQLPAGVSEVALEAPFRAPSPLPSPGRIPQNAP